MFLSFCLILTYFFLSFKVYLFARHRESSQLLILYLVWTLPLEPGAMNSIHVSHMGGRGSFGGAILLVSQEPHQQEAGTRSQSWELNLGTLILDVGILSSFLNSRPHACPCVFEVTLIQLDRCPRLPRLSLPLRVHQTLFQMTAVCNNYGENN